ncbi:hypothetical protein R8Z50_21470 [Longispora sp. K20-0274]|uniref:hypothetical protein n=1 Tax=Longispora sp. K20-0274 TaxID=3088255 RepID=UPI00399B29F0
MALVSVSGDELLVEIEGMHKLWALKGRLRIPLAHVRGAVVDPARSRRPRGLRLPGTYLPGILAAGTYRSADGRAFWDVRDPDRAVVIDLVEEDFTELVLQVADPHATARLITDAIRPHW